MVKNYGCGGFSFRYDHNNSIDIEKLMTKKRAHILRVMKETKSKKAKRELRKLFCKLKREHKQRNR